ncbi:MAG: FkbM family methyltransferase [candidate division WOR-3 bacterium]
MRRLVNIIGLLAALLPQSIRLGLYKTSFASFIRNYMNRVVPNGLTLVNVASGPVKNMKLYLNLKEEKYYWLGTYEPQLIAAIYDLCRPGMIVYDIGANIGYISLVFARVVGKGRVFAFEPLPANAKNVFESMFCSTGLRMSSLSKSVR